MNISSLGFSDVSAISPQDSTLIQQNFIMTFCNEMKESLVKTLAYVNVPTDQRHIIENFLEDLKKGQASFENQEKFSRLVGIAIQITFENLLASKLESGEITSVEVFFLGQLPATSFCHSLKEPKNINLDWEEWLLYQQNKTTRSLREAGASLRMVYSQSHYQTWSEMNKDLVEAYETEKKWTNFYDYPLSTTIPQELLGNFYIFKDKEGNRYQFLTKSVTPHGKELRQSNVWFESLESNCSESYPYLIQTLMLLNQHIDQLPNGI